MVQSTDRASCTRTEDACGDAENSWPGMRGYMKSIYVYYGTVRYYIALSSGYTRQELMVDCFENLIHDAALHQTHIRNTAK